MLASHPRGVSVALAALAAAVALAAAACSKGTEPRARMSIVPDSASIAVGGQVQLSANNAPGAVTWQSSSDAIATVTGTGFVTGVSAGAATITLSSGNDQATATVRVLNPAAIGLSTASVALAATAGGADPAPATVNVTNAGQLALTGLSLPGTQYGPGASGWLDASLGGTDAPATLTLRATTGALAPGTYTATVPVAANGAVNSPQNVIVTFTVGQGPAIATSASTASFSGVQGTSPPAASTVSVTNGGGGTLSGLSADVTYPSGPNGWLTASLDRTTAPATLTLQPNTTNNLGTGTFQATVTLRSSIAGVAPATVTVTYSLVTQPSIALAPSTLTFGAAVSGANPSAQVVNVTNGGGAPLTGLAASISYTANQPTGWLAATLNQTTAPAQLTVQATTGALPAGTYTATIAVSSPVAGNSPQTVSVSFVVSTRAVIALNPTSVQFAATASQGNPASQSVSVTNAGGSPLTGLAVGSIQYGASQPTGWLTATLNGTSAPATLTLQPTTGALPPGTYTATVPVTSGVASNSPQNVSVTFTVAAAPAIALSSGTATFNANQGGANPPSVPITVTNSGSGTLSGLNVSSIQYGGGQPTGWLTATLNGTTAPATLTLQATTGALAAGTYNATVFVASPVASNSPRSVAVTFTVAQLPSIGLGSTNLTFSNTTVGAIPSQPVAITNTGGGTLTGLAASITYANGQPTGWLTASLNTTTAPATLTLSAAVGSLTPNQSYTATVSVTSPVASNSPQQITVTFTVLFSFSTHIFPKIQQYCNSCHFAGGNQPDLSTQSAFFTNMINVGNKNTQTFPLASKVRIKPGNSAQSYVIDQILKNAGAQAMPTSASVNLAVSDPAFVAAFRAWIDAGAPRN